MVASLALFVALGGSAYAAGVLPVNSVGTPQLKGGSVTSGKVKDGALNAVNAAKEQLKVGSTGEPAQPDLRPRGHCRYGAGLVRPRQWLECRSHRAGSAPDEIPRRARRAGLVRDDQADLDHQHSHLSWWIRTARAAPMLLGREERLCIPEEATRMTSAERVADESERSAALDGWVAAFDRDFAQSADFATSIATMKAHGCFDVRAVVERWVLANPTGNGPSAQVEPARQEPAPLQPVLELVPALEAAAAPQEPAVDGEPAPPRLEAGSSPDIAYFHNLLQGGIDVGQIHEAFPAFRLVIDEAVGQHEAAAPILSEVPAGPTRQDLDNEIRGIREELQSSRKRERRRWRRD